MQNLVFINAGGVVVQFDGLSYAESYENFLSDGGKRLPDGITSLDYNQTLKQCIINGEAFQAFPNAFAEEVLKLAPKIIASFESRKAKKEEEERQERIRIERIEQEKKKAERFDSMTAEEREAYELTVAKQEREVAVEKITVEVDGMVFDGDETSQQRMSRTISAAIALGVNLDEQRQVWVLADNSVAQPTVKQLAEALRLAGEKQTELWTMPYES